MTICPYCKEGNHHLCMEGYAGGCECKHAQQEGWEKDFDRAFGVQATAAVDGTPCEGFFYEDGESRRPAPERIKSFIRTLLTSATRDKEKEVLEWVRDLCCDLVKKNNESTPDTPYYNGLSSGMTVINDCIQDRLASLDK